MNILMIEVAASFGDGSVPAGVLCAASSVYRKGHNVKIIDLVTEQIDYAGIRNIIDEFRPHVIGLGGITSSYRNCKELMLRLKWDYGRIPLIVGGVITSVSDLLLTRAGADYIVHGEGEISFPNLIEAIQEDRDPALVNGISFRRNSEIIRTPPQAQITDLDAIPFPEYSLLNMNRYFYPIEKWVDWYFRNEPSEAERIYEKLSGKKYIMPLMTARGCTHKCIFCYRHQRGIRQHSVEYAISLMNHLRKTYGAGMFQIQDELTTYNKTWVMQFCNRIIAEEMGIFFIVLSARVDTVDEEMLSRLKEAGCLMLNYGYESGSNVILKEIRKGVTREQALKAGLLSKKIGIKNIPEMMIGFPSETEATVSDTIDFLKRLDMWPISINVPIPFPRTPLWEYGVKNKIIGDEEEFILQYRRGLFVNFTKFSDKKLARLVTKVQYDTHLHWLWKRRRYLAWLFVFLKKIFVGRVRFWMPEKTYLEMKKVYGELRNRLLGRT